jgi:hypothetical protein
MSPARVLESIHKENELQTLTSALDALLVTAHQLSLREQELQRRASVAHDEVSLLFCIHFISFFDFLRDEKIFITLALDREPLAVTFLCT